MGYLSTGTGVLLHLGEGDKKMAIEKVLKLGIISDIHLKYSPKNLISKKGSVLEPLERLEVFLEDMKNKKADAILSLGDFCVDFTTETGQKALNKWNRWDGEKIAVMGNHDSQCQSKTDYITAMNMPSTYYSRVAYGIRFCILDSSSETEPYWQGASCPDKDQLEWLEEELLTSREKAIIALHDGYWPELTSLINRVNNRLGKTQVIACLYGHHHKPNACKRKGVWYICFNSVSYRWIAGGADKVYWYREPLYSLMTVIPHSGEFELVGTGTPYNWATDLCSYKEPIEPDTLTYQISIPQR